MSVEHFKWHIYDEAGVPVEKQILKFKGDKLDD
jgi:hypothetical protein